MENISMFNLDDIRCSAINFSILSDNVPKWMSCLFIIWYVLLSSCSILFNLGVFVLFFRYKNLRTPGNSFFMCLALSDLLIGGLVVPWKITCYIAFPRPIEMRLMVILVDYLLSVAFLSICGLTYDRYQAIVNPMTYSLKVNSKTIKLSYVLIWGLPMIHLVRFIWFLFPGMSAFSNDSKFSTFVIASMASLILTVVSAYCRIFREAHNHEAQVREIQMPAKSGKTRKTGKTRMTRMTKAFRSCMAVTLCFLCCWIPRTIFMGRMFLKYPRSLTWDLLTFGLMVLSSNLNPILYSVYSHDIRTVILDSKLYSRMKRRWTSWGHHGTVVKT